MYNIDRSSILNPPHNQDTISLPTNGIAENKLVITSAKKIILFINYYYFLIIIISIFIDLLI